MVRKIKIPYDVGTLELNIEERNLKAVITAGSDEFWTEKTESEMIEDALKNPIGSPRLSQLAKGKKKVVLVTSDHTRAVPSRLTLPLLLKEIRNESRMQILRF